MFFKLRDFIQKDLREKKLTLIALFVFLGFVADYIFLKEPFLSRTISVFDISVPLMLIPSVVVAVASTMFISFSSVIILCVIFSFLLLFLAKIPAYTFFYVLIVYFIPAFLFFIFLKTFELSTNKLNLRVVFSLMLASLISGFSTYLSMTAFIPRGQMLFLIRESIYELCIVNSIIIYISVLFMIAVLGRYSTEWEIEKKRPFINWQAGAIIVAILFISFYMVAQETKLEIERIRNVSVNSTYEEIEQINHLLTKVFSEDLKINVSMVEQLAIFYGVNFNDPNSVLERGREIYLQRAYAGVEGIYLLNGDYELISGVGASMDAKLLAACSEYFFEAKKSEKKAPFSDQRTYMYTFNSGGNIKVAACIPVPQASEVTLGESITSKAKEKGYVLLVNDVGILSYNLHKLFTMHDSYFWCYFLSEKDDAVLIRGGNPVYSLGDKAEQALVKLIERGETEKEKGRYSFFGYNSKTKGFDINKRDQHIFVIGKTVLPGGEIVKVTARPVSVILQETRGLEKELLRSLSVHGGVDIILLVILFLGANYTNSRLQLLLKSKESDLRESLKKEQKSLEELIENLPTGLLLVDSLGKIRFVNFRGSLFVRNDSQNSNRGKSLKGTPLANIYKTVFKTREIVRTDIPHNNRIFAVTAAIANISGEDLCVISVNDVTEVRKMQQRAIIESRQRTLGELSAGVVHELGNPLSIALGFTEILASDEELPAEKKDMAVASYEATKRVSEIVKNMLIFARGRKEEISRDTYLNEVVERVVRLLEPSLQENEIDIELKLHPEPLLAVVNPANFEQILMNILLNAKTALLENKNTKREIIVESYQENNSAVISVSDNGPGILEDIQQYIFDPFFTTKEVGGGTGLGLSISYQLARQDNGHIEVSSIPGEGATFKIIYPLKAK